MDPVTAITTILALIPDFLMTSGGRLIEGGYIGGRYYSTTALMKSGYLYTGGYIYTAGKRKKNPWVRYLKVFRRYVNKSYTYPDRKKIAKEIYLELKKSGQLEMLLKHHKLPLEIKEKLDKLLVIKPKTGAELALVKKDEEKEKEKALEFPHIFEPKTGPMEFPYIFEPKKGPMEFQHIGLPEPPGFQSLPTTQGMEFQHIGLPEPSTSQPSSIVSSVTPVDEEIMGQVAHENLAEVAEKTIRNIPAHLPDDTKVDILVKNIQDKQQELVSQGNLMATDANILLGALSDAAIKEPEPIKGVIIQAAIVLTGKDPIFVRKFISAKERTIQAVLLPPSERRLPLPPVVDEESIKELPFEEEKKVRRRDRG
jgi:hypothetical protein